jgi:hypothetical protein
VILALASSVTGEVQENMDHVFIIDEICVFDCHYIDEFSNFSSYSYLERGEELASGEWIEPTPYKGKATRVCIVKSSRCTAQKVERRSDARNQVHPPVRDHSVCAAPECVIARRRLWQLY